MCNNNNNCNAIIFLHYFKWYILKIIMPNIMQFHVLCKKISGHEICFIVKSRFGPWILTHESFIIKSLNQDVFHFLWRLVWLSSRIAGVYDTAPTQANKSSRA